MLSDKVKVMAKQWLDLGFELDARIRAETGDALGLYVQRRLHFLTNFGRKLTKEQVKDLVGPIILTGTTENHDHYAFMLGDAACVILLDKSDSHGEPYDVGIN